MKAPARLRTLQAHLLCAPAAVAETLNDWAQKTPLSPTLAIKDTADAMRAAGTKVRTTPSWPRSWANFSPL